MATRLSTSGATNAAFYGTQAIVPSPSGPSGSLCYGVGINRSIQPSRYFGWAAGCYLKSRRATGASDSSRVLGVRGIRLVGRGRQRPRHHRHRHQQRLVPVQETGSAAAGRCRSRRRTRAAYAPRAPPSAAKSSSALVTPVPTSRPGSSVRTRPWATSSTQRRSGWPGSANAVRPERRRRRIGAVGADLCGQPARRAVAVGPNRRAEHGRDAVHHRSGRPPDRAASALSPAHSITGRAFVPVGELSGSQCRDWARIT